MKLPFFFLKRHWLKILILLIVGLPAVGIAFFIFTPAQPEYVTADAVRGDLVQTVEAVGEVISEKDLELKFPVSGIVANVFVKEGDIVEAGEKLAELRSSTQAADVASARASLLASQAELQLMLEGTRPEEIRISEAEVQNKRSSLASAQEALKTAESKLKSAQQKLDATKKEVNISLAGTVANAGSTISKELSTDQTSLNVLKDVLANLDVQNYIVLSQPAEYYQMKQKQDTTAAELSSILSRNLYFSDYQTALQSLIEARNAASKAAEVLRTGYDFIANMPVTGSFTSAERETLKNTVAIERTDTETALTNLSSAIKSLQDASAGFDTTLASEEANLVAAQTARDQALADINTYQTALTVAEESLKLKQAGTRPADIDAARARVAQAAASLQSATANFEDTILYAPIDAKITKVNLKPGEFTPGQFSETDAAMTILGTTPYRIEMHASEIDIPKVHLSQSGSIELDAFPGVDYALRVSEIDPAATIVDGVAKYRLVLDFVYPHEEFKIGMTGDTQIISDSRIDVVMIPGRAVIENNEGQEIVRILNNKKVEERPVVTGLENDTDIEVVSGVEEGETVVVLIKE